MFRFFRDVLREEAEAVETGAAPAADDDGGAAATESAAWEAAKEAAVERAQEAIAEGDGGELKPDAAAKPAGKPAAKAKAKAAPKPAAKTEPADETLDELQEDAPGSASSDEDLGDLDPQFSKPRSKLERLRLKAKREGQQNEWQQKEAEYQQQLAALEQQYRQNSGGMDEARRLFADGKVDEAIKLLGAKGFAEAQQRYLEGKGSLSKAERELAELKAEREAEKARKQQEEEMTAAQRRAHEQQAAIDQERQEFLDEAAASPFREIRGLATSPITSHAFGVMLLQSINTPEYADRDMKFHYQVARNAYRELYQDLGKVFGSQDPSPAATNQRDPDRSRVESATQPEAAKPKSLSQSNQAEARGGARNFPNEQEAWNHHTRSVRSG